MIVFAYYSNKMLSVENIKIEEQEEYSEFECEVVVRSDTVEDRVTIKGNAQYEDEKIAWLRFLDTSELIQIIQ